MDSKKRIRRLAFYFIYGFIGFFLFRLAYGYASSSPKEDDPFDYISDFFEGNSGLKRNYASDKYMNTSSIKAKYSEQESAPVTVISEQKFEKIASLQSRTEEFEKDEKTVRGLVGRYNSLIQYEHNQGNPGYRQVHLSIGVPPAQFDSMITDIRKVGKLLAIQVTKTDKTNEYRNMNAQKASLEKTRTTLMELRDKPGKIDEYMALTNRILEIEQQLQELGVSLGDFDAENEFCTVRLTLAEREKYVPPTISILHRIKVALEWTIKYYFVFVSTIALIFFSAFCITRVADWLKPVMARINKK
ncbi:MAG: DUF4349 domain-containing protein [Bacteroidota bacterium]